MPAILALGKEIRYGVQSMAKTLYNSPSALFQARENLSNELGHIRITQSQQSHPPRHVIRWEQLSGS